MRFKVASGLISSRKPFINVDYSSISASSKDGRWVEAHALIKKMKTRGLPPDIIKYSAATACEKGGRWEQALARFLARWHHSAAPPVPTQSVSPLYKFLRRDTSAIFGPFTYSGVSVHNSLRPEDHEVWAQARRWTVSTH